MVNKKYQHGKSREYYLINGLKKQGFITLRMAGSHGFSDLIAIDKEHKIINFIQSKPKSMSKQAKRKLERQFKWLNDKFDCHFFVISLLKEIKHAQEIERSKF